MVKRAPSILEYLHAPQGTYRTIDTPMPRAPVDRLAGRWGQGPAPEFMVPQLPNSEDTTPQMLGPGGITNAAPYEGAPARHMSLASVLAAPLAAPDTPPAPGPMGLLPGMNPGGVKNDAGVGPLTAAAPPMNPTDLASAMNPLRLPRHVQPGHASQASVNAVRGYDQVGDLNWLAQLLAGR